MSQLERTIHSKQLSLPVKLHISEYAYGEYAYPRQWCSMLFCLRDHGLADELMIEKPAKSVFFLRHGGAVGSEVRAVLQVWSLNDSSIEWLLTEPSCSD